MTEEWNDPISHVAITNAFHAGRLKGERSETGKIMIRRVDLRRFKDARQKAKG